MPDLSLSDHDVSFGIDCMRLLHRWPETAGEERRTAQLVREWLLACNAQVMTNLGPEPTVQHHSLMGVFPAREGSPVVVLRCELDGLAIHEDSHLPHRSEREGFGHLCGHDGHMGILLAVASALSRAQLSTQVVLLFQAAEEVGAGAAAVLSDERFRALRPDTIFALHNIPGSELGEVLLREGSFCCASRGVRVDLAGRSAHAASPETGLSPAPALAELIQTVATMEAHAASSNTFATLVGARAGTEAYGTAPGHASLFATLRAEQNGGVDQLQDQLFSAVDTVAKHHALSWSHAINDTFAATVNDPAWTAFINTAAISCGASVSYLEEPFRFSEDFGLFLENYPGAMFGLGSGRSAAALHDPRYLFPEALVERGASLWLALLNLYV